MFDHVSHWLYRHLLWLLLVAYVGTPHLWGQDFKISIILLLLACFSSTRASA